MTISKYTKVAIRAAYASGLLIKRSVGKISNVSYKGRDNIVTNVDRSSEELIIKMILRAFPDHSILSEESSPIDSGSRYRWVIDPIDGTTNFAHAFPFFCVSIALEESGKIILGVVYDPMRDEIFIAGQGRGATLNGKKIKVSRVDKLSNGFLATGFSYGITRKDRNIMHFSKLLVKTQAIRRAGSAALDLCYVACGRFDGFWEMNLHPWDSAAASLIVREAKGVVTKFDGKSYSHYDKNILATNGRIHSQMVKVLS
ncbi:MAG: inositol monophosphatase family protein [Candidatus Omnitrophica bacterium]|nr:inositol monophosphatase family protein [Candidatus Omnitrophota bacterium]